MFNAAPWNSLGNHFRIISLILRTLITRKKTEERSDDQKYEDTTNSFTSWGKILWWHIPRFFAHNPMPRNFRSDFQTFTPTTVLSNRGLQYVVTAISRGLDWKIFQREPLVKPWNFGIHCRKNHMPVYLLEENWQNFPIKSHLLPNFTFGKKWRDFLRGAGFIRWVRPKNDDVFINFVKAIVLRPCIRSQGKLKTTPFIVNKTKREEKLRSSKTKQGRMQSPLSTQVGLEVWQQSRSYFKLLWSSKNDCTIFRKLLHDVRMSNVKRTGDRPN